MTLPTDAQFFSKTDPSKPDVGFLKNHFYREGRLSEEHALFILEKGTEILRAEPNLLYVDAPVTGASYLQPSCSITVSLLLCPLVGLAIFSVWRYSWTICERLVARFLGSVLISLLQPSTT